MLRLTVSQTTTILFMTLKFDRCPACGKYAFLPHICPPTWYVRLAAIRQDEDDKKPEIYPEQEQNFTSVRAKSAEEAAELYAKSWDEGEYDVVAGNQIIDVIVRANEPDDEAEEPPVEETFRVCGYSEPVYSAKKIANAPAPEK